MSTPPTPARRRRAIRSPLSRIATSIGQVLHLFHIPTAEDLEALGKDPDHELRRRIFEFGQYSAKERSYFIVFAQVQTARLQAMQIAELRKLRREVEALNGLLEDGLEVLAEPPPSERLKPAPLDASPLSDGVVPPTKPLTPEDQGLDDLAEDLDGEIEDLDGEVEDLDGEVEDLDGEVEDVEDEVDDVDVDDVHEDDLR